MDFYVGLHIPAHAGRFERSMVSASVLRRRVSGFAAGEWIMDSGAFTEVLTHGGFRRPVSEHAALIERFAAGGESESGRLVAVVAQDYMCEPAALAATGGSVAGHQRMTVARYEELLAEFSGAPPVHVMPVLQGYCPREYAACARLYGDLLGEEAWVGVGSVCKRNRSAAAIADVLCAIRAERPDLALHLFGVKTTALADGYVRECAASADSMAWSFSARRQGRSANDWREAEAFRERIETTLRVDSPVQRPLNLFEHPSRPARPA